MEVGDSVSVKAPFDVAFSGIYVIMRVEEVDGTLVYFLNGIEGAFDLMYLERA